MTQKLRIDFVSDVACPWCAIGLASLQAALARLGDEVQVDLHFQPYELNPQMGPEGESLVGYLSKKLRQPPEQIERNQVALHERGAAVGFQFGRRESIYNTFDAHRLLYWAGQQDSARQLALKQGLMQAYHGRGENVSDPTVLADVAAAAGLDRDDAAAVLASDRYASEVRERERFFQSRGIQGVPAVILQDRWLVSGGQPPEVFEQALRQAAQQATA